MAVPCVERVDPAARKLPGTPCTRNIGTASVACRSSPIVVALATSSFVHDPRALVARSRVVVLDVEFAHPLCDSCQPFGPVGVRVSDSLVPFTHSCVTSTRWSIAGCQDSFSSTLWFGWRSTGASDVPGSNPKRLRSARAARSAVSSLIPVLGSLAGAPV